MGGAAVFQVADDADGEVIQAAFFDLDRIKVSQRLRRVLVGAVAAVNDRHARQPRKFGCAAHLVMADDDQVGVADDHARRVGQ